VKRSADHIVVTHCGSLPRPEALLAFLSARDSGQAYDPEQLADCISESVRDVVCRQVELGVDVVDDGEHSKMSFTTYTGARLAGFEAVEEPGARGERTLSRDEQAFADVYAEQRAMYAARPSAMRRWKVRRNYVCTGPIRYAGHSAVQQDITNLRKAMKASDAQEGFVTALSPSNVAPHYRNAYYATEEEYVVAIADAMHEEYQAIVDAGFLVQIDDPRLATYYDRTPDASLEDCRGFIARDVELVNYALRGIPEDCVRFHTCYSTNVAPRVHDLELKHFVDLMLGIRAGAYSIEAANPRHEHEWQVWEDVRLPEEKVLIPGVVSHCVMLVEHPELVAQRILRYASVLGRERVLASNDCGFATSAAGDEVHPDVAWAKMKALCDGARLASRQLWGT
jgi:5-methyltetrahydropteroyltriglutamate--homocysteine methyltransferase